MSEPEKPPDAEAPRPETPRPVTVEVPGMAGPTGGDQGPETPSMHQYLGDLTAHDLRIKMEEAQKYTQREMKKVVDETKKEARIEGWIRTALIAAGIFASSFADGCWNSYVQRKATAETKVTVEEAVAPVEMKLDMALDGGIKDPGRPPWR